MHVTFGPMLIRKLEIRTHADNIMLLIFVLDFDVSYILGYLVLISHSYRQIRF